MGAEYMGLLDASATMNAYDSIERGAADECEPLRGRRPRTFTLTQLLVACVAVGVCAIAATMVVNTPRATSSDAHLGVAHLGDACFRVAHLGVAHLGDTPGRRTPGRRRCSREIWDHARSWRTIRTYRWVVDRRSTRTTQWCDLITFGRNGSRTKGRVQRWTCS